MSKAIERSRNKNEDQVEALGIGSEVIRDLDEESLGEMQGTEARLHKVKRRI